MRETDNHQLSPHKKDHVPLGYVSNLMLDRALDAILRRVKRIDHDHDVPGLACYSNDGKTIYIDRRVPKTFEYKGRSVDVFRYLIMHEEVEKTLRDQLGLHYYHAHQIALRAEEAAVRADHIGWREYDAFMQKYINLCWSEKAEDMTHMPPDMDLTPYKDIHDTELLEQMEKALHRGDLMKHPHHGGQELHDAVATHVAMHRALKNQTQPGLDSTSSSSV